VTVLTVPEILDIARNHVSPSFSLSPLDCPTPQGVLGGPNLDPESQSNQIFRAHTYLQKPSVQEMFAKKVILDSSLNEQKESELRTLIDTGYESSH
jgi:hypothetical protein